MFCFWKYFSCPLMGNLVVIFIGSKLHNYQEKISFLCWSFFQIILNLFFTPEINIAPPPPFPLNGRTWLFIKFGKRIFAWIYEFNKFLASHIPSERWRVVKYKLHRCKCCLCVIDRLSVISPANDPKLKFSSCFGFWLLFLVEFIMMLKYTIWRGSTTPL